MKVRAYQPPDAPVRIVHPNPRLREAGESDEAFLDRICALTLERDPTLGGLPSVDLNADDLPKERIRVDPNTKTEKAVRAAWKIDSTRVVIDEVAAEALPALGA